LNAVKTAKYLGSLIRLETQANIIIDVPKKYIAAGLEDSARNFLMRMKLIGHSQDGQKIIEALTPSEFLTLMKKEPIIERMTLKGPIFVTHDLVPMGPKGLEHQLGILIQFADERREKIAAERPQEKQIELQTSLSNLSKTKLGQSKDHSQSQPMPVRFPAQVQQPEKTFDEPTL